MSTRRARTRESEQPNGPAAAREPKRLSADQAAQVLGLSVFTLRAWIRQRRLPFFRIGRRIVFDRDDLEAFLQAHRVEAWDTGPTIPFRARRRAAGRATP